MYKKMTKQMNKAVQEIYWNASVENINKSTLKALKYREIVGDDNKLTKSGHHYAITKMSLVKQCAEVSIPLDTIKLSYIGSPESALLKHYQSLGYIGLSTEGVGILTVLKALMLDDLILYNPFGDCIEEGITQTLEDYHHAYDDSCISPVTSQLQSLGDKADEVISSIKSISKNKFISNFKVIISNWYIALEYPELNIDFGIALYDAINKDTFISLANKVKEGGYRFGWPDLTLIKGREVLFVEVKTTDKLHDSQLYTITGMRKIIPFPFSVCKIVR